MSKINIVVIGTNDFVNDYNFFEEKLYEKLKKYFEKNYKIIIREQETNLIDKFAIRFAKENNCKLEKYKIQWKLGKRAEFENIKKLIWGEEANDGADLLLAFQNKWDGAKDKYILNKLIQEFKSMIDFESFNSKKYFLFTR